MKVKHGPAFNGNKIPLLLLLLKSLFSMLMLGQVLVSTLSLHGKPPSKSLCILDKQGYTYIYPLFASLFLGSIYDIENPLSPTDLDLNLLPVSGPGPSPFKSKLCLQISHIQNFSFLITTPTAEGRKILNHYNSQLMALAPTKNNRAWLSIILLLAGDLHQNPGPRPPKFPCGLCKKACTSKTPAVACDSCDVWYHTHCMAMNSETYRTLRNVSWHCSHGACQFKNFELYFDTSSSNSSFDSSNPFHPISPSVFNHSHASNHTFDHSSPPKQPNSTSTPKSKPIKKNPTSQTATPRRNNPNSDCACPQIENSSSTQATKTKPAPFKNEFTVLNANFQSLWHKRVELCNLALETKSDIIVGTETWLTGDVKNSELLLDDYDVYRRDRASRGGGVLIAVKKSLFCQHISTSTNSETLSVKIKLNGQKPLIICAVYRPPDYTFQESIDVVNEIQGMFDKNKGAISLVCGDFNLPDVDWVNQEVKSYQYPKPINEAYIEFAHDLGLSQIVDKPTRGATSILDLCFTNYPHLINKCEIIPGLGDHEIVKISASIRPPRKKPVKREIQLWNKVDEAALRSDVHKFSETFLAEGWDWENKDVKVIWDHIKGELTKIIEKHVPSKLTSSRTHQPWINQKIKSLVRKKNRWFQKAKECHSATVWKKYKNIKNQCQKACRQAHDQYLNNIFSEDKTDKKLWGYIKSRNQENCGIGDLQSGDGVKIARDPTEKADIIHTQFDSVFSNPIPKIINFFRKEDRLPTFDRIYVRRSGLLKLLLNINVHKAKGPDNIPGRLLKICAHELVDVYQILFQASLDQGIVPPDWKGANVVPLFKKGDKSKAENYRPISLTSISCKILEHVVHSNIMGHLDRFNILDDAQHGFRKRRSCVTQLISTLNDFADCLKTQKQIDAIVLDFSKAFDKVDHEGLLLKLDHLGIRNSMLSWIRSFLIGRTQKVLVDGKTSTPKPVASGVPQGTVLGPLFFLIYINDISEGLSEGTKLKLLADDSLLYRVIRSDKDVETLQKDLETLQAWESKWKMEFHPGKCQHLRITNKIKPIDSQYRIHGITIEKTESAKYLGIVIDSNLKWKQHYKEVAKKTNGVLALLRRNFSKCSVDVKSKCYRTLVRPRLEYGCQVWDPGYQVDIDHLEKIQKRGTRFVTGNYKMETGNSEKNLSSLGYDTLEERRLKNKIIIFQKARLKLIDIPTGHLDLKTRDTRMGGGDLAYHRPASAIDSHIFSFFPSTIYVWNRLPKEVKSCKDIDKFAKMIDVINLTSIKNATN